MMHQIVMNLILDHGECLCNSAYVDVGLNIDHINFNKLDNRTANLQLISKEMNNSRNNGKQAHHSSQYKGVTCHKGTETWRAEYRLQGKNKYLGLFKSEEEAARARDQAVRDLGLDYVLNFP